MKLNKNISLFLLTIFLNCTANASSDDEMSIDDDQHETQVNTNPNNKKIKRKRFKTNTNLVQSQNKATKRTWNEFSNESTTNTINYNDVIYDQAEDELYEQNPDEMNLLCDLLTNINVSDYCEKIKLKTGNH